MISTRSNRAPALLVFPGIKIVGRFFGDKQNRVISDRSVDADVDVPERLVEAVVLFAVEALVIFLFSSVLFFFQIGTMLLTVCSSVYASYSSRFLPSAGFLDAHPDGIADEVRILFDQGPQPERVKDRSKSSSSVFS
jgi:hypothetical protein